MNQQNQSQSDDDEAWHRTLCDDLHMGEILQELFRRATEEGCVEAAVIWLTWVDGDSWPEPVFH